MGAHECNWRCYTFTWICFCDLIIWHIAFMTVREAIVRSLFAQNVKGVIRLVITHPVAAVVGEPEFLGDGVPVETLGVAHTGGDDLPSTMGALRSDLQNVLVNKFKALGIEIHLGTTMTSYENKGDTIDVTYNDGSVHNYDLVIAADGIKSPTRKMLGSKHDKKQTGLGIWRVVTKRSPEMDCSGMAYGGDEYKAGYTPISEDLCYCFVLTEPVRPDNGLTDAQEMKRLLASYHGHFDFIRENIQEDDFMNF